MNAGLSHTNAAPPANRAPGPWQFIIGARGIATPAARTLQLERDQVLCLKKSSGITRIHVREGSIWLTGTPALGDVILRTGDKFDFNANWPFVIQALGTRAVLIAR